MTDVEWREERRRNDGLVVELMQAIKEKVECIDDRLTRHIIEEEKQIRNMMTEAFPSGDAYGHRLAHEAFIKDMNERHELRKALIEKVATGSVWTAIGVIVAMTWYWLKGHL